MIDDPCNNLTTSRASQCASHSGHYDDAPHACAQNVLHDSTASDELYDCSLPTTVVQTTASSWSDLGPRLAHRGREGTTDIQQQPIGTAEDSVPLELWEQARAYLRGIHAPPGVGRSTTRRSGISANGYRRAVNFWARRQLYWLVSTVILQSTITESVWTGSATTIGSATTGDYDMPTALCGKGNGSTGW